MKFLEYTPLESVKAFIQHVDVGDYFVEGVLEAYSCKLAGVDKKLSRSLDQEVQEVASFSPPGVLSNSPVGPLTEAASRRTLIYLILTLNHIYPDYDFSLLRAHNFSKEDGVDAVQDNVDTLLIEASKLWKEEQGKGRADLVASLWAVINEVISIYDCDIYSYNPNESDPFGEDGHIWSFNYFFYNKKLKRILYFSAKAKARSAASTVDEEEAYNTYEDIDDEYKVFDAMDDI